MSMTRESGLKKKVPESRDGQGIKTSNRAACSCVSHEDGEVKLNRQQYRLQHVSDLHFHELESEFATFGDGQLLQHVGFVF
jgi:hypothetical protein